MEQFDEDRYRRLVENAADVVFSTTPDGTYDYVSRSVRDLLGWAPEDLIGRHPPDLVHPDDLSWAQQHLIGVASGERRDFRIRARTADGRYRLIGVTVRPVRDEHGALIGRAGSWRDVDAEVATERALRDEQRILRATLDGLLDPHVAMTAIRDEDGRIVDFAIGEVNPAALPYLGRRSRDEVIGARLRDLYPSKAAQSLLLQYARIIETGEPLILDEHVYPAAPAAGGGAGGAERWFDLRGSGVGETVILSWREVTERHEAQRRLAESEARYRLLAQNASDVVLQSLPRGPVTWVSPSVEAVLGWRPDQIVGRSMKDLIHPHDLPDLRAAQVASIAAGVTEASVTIRVRTAQGDWRWMSDVGRVVYAEDGSPRWGIDALRDVDAEMQAQRALAEAEARYRMLADHAGDVVVEMSLTGVLYYASPAITQVLGWSVDDLLGTNVWDLAHPDDLAGAESAASAFLTAGGRTSARTVRFRCKDGSFRWIGAVVSGVPGEDGSPVALVATWRDVQAEVTAQQALAAAEAQYRLLAENATDVVFRSNAQGVLTFCSDGIFRTLGWTPQQMVGRRDTDLIHPDDLPAAQGPRSGPDPDVLGPYRVRMRSVSGTYRWIEISARVLRDDEGGASGQVGGWHDVTAEVQAEQELARRARTDALTGLLNRDEILQRLAVILAPPAGAGERLAILFCDLDELKVINDSRGHAAGDLLLREVAARVAATVRDGDLVARIGGDELLVVLSGVPDLRAAAAVAEKVRVVVSRPVETNPRVSTTVSIGVTLAAAGDDVDTVINRADRAMYEAKRQGGNQVVAAP